MGAIGVIEKVLETLPVGPLMSSMVDVPATGATPEELAAEEKFLPRRLSRHHQDLLKRWNGINLDMIRVYGVGQTDPTIMRLCRSQLDISQDFPGWIVFASSPAGFVCAEDSDGVVHSYDTQAMLSPSGAAKKVALDIDDFFSRFVFGPDSDGFCGVDWKALLLTAGVFSRRRSNSIRTRRCAPGIGCGARGQLGHSGGWCSALDRRQRPRCRRTYFDASSTLRPDSDSGRGGQLGHFGGWCSALDRRQRLRCRRTAFDPRSARAPRASCLARAGTSRLV
jgi:hypothetical protein